MFHLTPQQRFTRKVLEGFLRLVDTEEASLLSTYHGILLPLLRRHIAKVSETFQRNIVIAQSTTKDVSKSTTALGVPVGEIDAKIQ